MINHAKTIWRLFFLSFKYSNKLGMQLCANFYSTKQCFLLNTKISKITLFLFNTCALKIGSHCKKKKRNINKFSSNISLSKHFIVSNKTNKKTLEMLKFVLVSSIMRKARRSEKNVPLLLFILFSDRDERVFSVLLRCWCKKSFIFWSSPRKTLPMTRETISEGERKSWITTWDKKGKGDKKIKLKRKKNKNKKHLVRADAVWLCISTINIAVIRIGL